MTKTEIIISPEYKNLSEEIGRIPAAFSAGEGCVLYSGRNEIRSLALGGKTVVVKRFRRLNFFRKIIYAFRSSKASRAFRNAEKLREMGFRTPREIAYIEERKNGFLEHAYLLTEFTSLPPLESAMGGAVDKPLLSAFAAFTAELHKKGISHNDLNNTNVLFSQENGQYVFELIDINRMTISAKSLSVKDCLYCLTRFSDMDAWFFSFLHEYIQARGWDESTEALGIALKVKHDERRERRKRTKRLFVK